MNRREAKRAARAFAASLLERRSSEVSGRFYYLGPETVRKIESAFEEVVRELATRGAPPADTTMRRSSDG